MRLSGPHFPILNRRLGRKHLSPDPFSKKNAPVPKPAKPSEICRAPGHDLTFPSHVQNLAENICCHTHFEKNERRRRSLSEHVHFFSPWRGPHFSMSSPKLGREFLSPYPFLKKRTPGPQPVLKNRVFAGHGKVLTFQSCVQDLAQNIRPRVRFRKNQHLHRRLPDMSIFFSP